jgi:hypothetical protein
MKAGLTIFVAAVGIIVSLPGKAAESPDFGFWILDWLRLG